MGHGEQVRPKWDTVDVMLRHSKHPAACFLICRTPDTLGFHLRTFKEEGKIIGRSLPQDPVSHKRHYTPRGNSSLRAKREQGTSAATCLFTASPVFEIQFFKMLFDPEVDRNRVYICNVDMLSEITEIRLNQFILLTGIGVLSFSLDKLYGFRLLPVTEIMNVNLDMI